MSRLLSPLSYGPAADDDTADAGADAPVSDARSDAGSDMAPASRIIRRACASNQGAGEAGGWEEPGPAISASRSGSTTWSNERCCRHCWTTRTSRSKGDESQ